MSDVPEDFSLDEEESYPNDDWPGSKKTWTTREQWNWLKDTRQAYLAAQKNKKLAQYLFVMGNEFFVLWPEIKVLFGHTDRTRLEEQENEQLNEAIAKRREQLRIWHKNQDRRRPTMKPLAGLLRAVGISKKASRLPQAKELYSKDRYYAEVQPAVIAKKIAMEAELGRKLLPKEILNNVKACTKEAYENATTAVKIDIRKRLTQAKEDAQAGRSGRALAVDSDRTAQQYQDAIDVTPQLLTSVLNPVSAASGWVFSLVGAGPVPEDKGKIGTISAHFGHDPQGPNFAQVTQNFEEQYVVPIGKYAKHVFPREVQKARSLEASGSSTPLSSGQPSVPVVPSVPQCAVPSSSTAVQEAVALAQEPTLPSSSAVMGSGADAFGDDPFDGLFPIADGSDLAPVAVPVSAPVQPVSDPALTPAQDPVAAQPAAASPVSQVPAVVQPAAAQVPAAQPAAASPVAQPAAASPVAQVPAVVQPATAQVPAAQPAASPGSQVPTVVQPAAAQVPAAQPVAAQPVAAQPVAAQPVVAQPIVPQLAAARVPASQPVAAQPVVPQPVAQVPTFAPGAATQEPAGPAQAVSVLPTPVCTTDPLTNDVDLVMDLDGVSREALDSMMEAFQLMDPVAYQHFMEMEIDNDPAPTPLGASAPAQRRSNRNTAGGGRAAAAPTPGESKTPATRASRTKTAPVTSETRSTRSRTAAETSAAATSETRASRPRTATATTTRTATQLADTRAALSRSGREQRAPRPRDADWTTDQNKAAPPRKATEAPAKRRKNAVPATAPKAKKAKLR